jgi:uncharacterized membrane-anchored protein
VIWAASILGLLGGFLLAYRMGRKLLPKLISATSDRMLAIWLALGGTIAMLLPAFFLSFVVGGTLGAALGEQLSQPLGLGIAGVPLGLAAGIAVVFAVTLLGGALGALGVARFIVWFRSRSSAEEQS